MKDRITAKKHKSLGGTRLSTCTVTCTCQPTCCSNYAVSPSSSLRFFPRVEGSERKTFTCRKGNKTWAGCYKTYQYCLVQFSQCRIQSEPELFSRIQQKWNSRLIKIFFFNFRPVVSGRRGQSKKVKISDTLALILHKSTLVCSLWYQLVDSSFWLAIRFFLQFPNL